MTGEVKLVDQCTHQRGVDAATGSDKASTYFDDEAHVGLSNLAIQTLFGDANISRGRVLAR